ncbi:hypothetical protein LZ30DRAFT_444609 [Colletotrichum cereale]|nr:hypothetical protein LZ30DRAFT_444609 [Colletotrichum cereale]
MLGGRPANSHPPLDASYEVLEHDPSPPMPRGRLPVIPRSLFVIPPTSPLVSSPCSSRIVSTAPTRYHNPAQPSPVYR